MADYRPEQLWKLYKKLPEELKGVIFSEETADNIYDICTRNGIEDDRISEIARYTGWVLLGLLPPNELEETFKKEIGIKPEVAEKVNFEINRFVFQPVKESLRLLYKMEVVPPAEIEEKPTTPKPAVSEKKSPRKDIYREPVE